MAPRIRKRRLAIIGAIAVLAAIAAITLRPKPAVVDVAVVTSEPLQVTIDEDGETRVRAHDDIASSTLGRFEPAGLREGDSVKAGTIVGRLYPLPLDARDREQAQARMRSTEAAQREAAARVALARTRLENDRRELARAEQLERAGHLASRDLDLARTAERSSASELEAALQHVEVTRYEAQGNRAALLGAGAGAGDSRAPAIVRSPIAGVVLRNYEEHPRAVAAGTPLIQVGDPRTMEIVVDLLSRDALAVSPGAPMMVDAGPGADSLRARVRRVEPSGFTKVSPLGVEEQRVHVIADLLDQPRALGDHFQVSTRIVVWQGDRVLQMPSGATFRDGRGWAAYAVRDGRAKMQTVKLGRHSTRMVEVTGGLSAGDTVILHPGDRLQSGARVRPAS
ncbi:MAG: HlyD family efflux transporter periplasmic adaptor subunit [Gemmatimonadaceae bacterium]|nr:HlyD family efflux transporter periplasmic adaptor subunit [Gemmatimonadaceae bacterium]